MPGHPFREVVFPNVQPEPPLVQFEAIPSSSITSQLGEEAQFPSVLLRQSLTHLAEISGGRLSGLDNQTLLTVT